MASILIVEDNPAAAEKIQQCFGRTGHTCTIEPSGGEVLETARRIGVDMIVLDVMLPRVSGFEVCRRIRRDPELYTIPILMVSAMNDQEEVLHGLAQGADDYVIKPLDLTNLLQRGEALLRANLGGSGADDLTQLPGLDGIRRGIQRLSSMRKTFAVAHCELMRLREFARERGMDLRNEAVKLLGNALKETGAELADEQFFVGHVGGGHFVVLLPASGIKPLCQTVTDQWAGAKDRFRPAASGQPKSPSKKSIELELLLCVTLREPKDATTPQQLFEILSQLRHKAHESDRGGIHLDRRALTPRSEAEKRRKKRKKSRRTSENKNRGS